MWKRLMVFFLVVCLCSTAAYAVDPLSMRLEGYTTAGGEIRIFCNTNLDAPPQKDEFSLTLGNTALPVKDVATLGNTDEGVSFIFLVDVSGSIKNAQLNGIKETLSALAGGLRANDNISVVTVGNETYAQGFVSAPAEIQSQIDAISSKNEDTNLYESIVKSLDILSTNESCRDKKYLVVFSDGEEDSVEGITRDEVDEKINASHIPVYTIAMLGNSPAKQYVETAKVLGSFARLSPGGRHYIHTLDKASSQSIAGDIAASVSQSLILTADLAGFSSPDGQTLLRLELTVAGAGKTGDSYTIPTAGLTTPEESPSPTPSPSETPAAAEPTPAGSPGTPADTEEATAPGLTSYVIWLIAGAAVAVTAIIVVIIIFLRKKRRVQTATVRPTPPAAPAAAPAPNRMPRIALRLTKVGLSEEEVYHAELEGQLVIGREPAKAGLTFEKDDLLSAKHCSISYEKDGVVLRDLGSKNGTFVNGVPISERYLLENDDILLIGSMELRLNWEPLGGK